MKRFAFSPFLLHYSYHHFCTPVLLFEPTWIIPLNSVYLCVGKTCEVP